MSQLPGILDFNLQLTPINRISPSRYEALKQCALREVWSAGRQPNLLPISPAARLGIVTHRLFEETGSGRFPRGNRAAIENRWNELVVEAEQAMFHSWLERHLIPLKTSVRDFEVHRIRAITRALEIAQISIPHVRDNRAISPEEGLEFWVESHDGLVGGCIDYVAKSQDGPIIREYKSGDILEDSLRELKASYKIQLKLYAALYKSTTGKWPTQLEVIPLQGSSVLVPFDRDSCSILLEDAANTLQRINNTIASFSTSKHEAEQHLANPNASTCRYCRFRPGCAAYQAARRVANETAGWPNDITGTLDEIQKLGNAKLMITVKTDHDTSSPAFIRGVTPEPSRHPAILHLQKGDRVGFFDLSSSSSGNTFTESPLAVIYKMNA